MTNKILKVEKNVQTDLSNLLVNKPYQHILMNEDSRSELISETSTNCHSSIEYQDNIEKVGYIFDKTLFTQINECEHIAKTERELEELKLKYSDKK